MLAFVKPNNFGRSYLTEFKTYFKFEKPMKVLTNYIVFVYISIFFSCAIKKI